MGDLFLLEGGLLAQIRGELTHEVGCLLFGLFGHVSGLFLGGACYLAGGLHALSPERPGVWLPVLGLSRSALQIIGFGNSISP